MSIDPKMDRITVNDVVFDVERNENNTYPTATTLTIEEFPGLEGKLGYEESGEDFSPRDWSNVGTMAVSYRGYKLGDEEIKDVDFEVVCDKCEGEGEYPCEDSPAGDNRCTCEKCEGGGYVTLNPVEYYKRQGAHVVLPLIVYEHSGITMSVGHVGDVIGDAMGWDTSFVGFIYDTPEKVKECIGDDATDEQIDKALRAEVEVYASYLEGDVTWWMVNDEETDYAEGCGGYVGESDYTERECFEAMERAIVKRLAEYEERAHWAARDTITS